MPPHPAPAGVKECANPPGPGNFVLRCALPRRPVAATSISAPGSPAVAAPGLARERPRRPRRRLRPACRSLRRRDPGAPARPQPRAGWQAIRPPRHPSLGTPQRCGVRGLEEGWKVGGGGGEAEVRGPKAEVRGQTSEVRVASFGHFFLAAFLVPTCRTPLSYTLSSSPGVESGGGRGLSRSRRRRGRPRGGRRRRGPGCAGLRRRSGRCNSTARAPGARWDPPAALPRFRS